MNKRSHSSFGGPSFEVVRAPTSRERFLGEMERALPWRDLRRLVEPLYASPASRHGLPLDLDRLLRIYFLQRWFHLSDTAVREELFDSAAMRNFACVGLARDAIPANSSICTFRQLLEEYGLGAAIFEAATRHLQIRGLAVSSGSIVGPTLIVTRKVAVDAPRLEAVPA